MNKNTLYSTIKYLKMDYIKYSSACLLICLLIASCKETKEDGIGMKPLSQVQGGDFKNIVLKNAVPVLSYDVAKPIIIDVPQHEYLNPNEIVESYTFIPLETNENSLIGDIYKLYTDDDYIFILDRDNDKVLQFTSDGKFVHKISNRGRGQSEYTEVWDFALDHEAKRVCLLDLAGRKLLYYDYKGNYVKEEPLYYFFTHMLFDKGKRFLHTGSSHNKNAPLIDLYRLVISDKEQRPLYRSFSMTEKIRNNFNVGLMYPLQKFSDEIYYNSVLSDTVWKIDTNKYEPAFVLNFPQRGSMFSSSDIENITNKIYNNKRRSVKCDFTGSYLLTDKIGLFNIGNKDVSGLYPLLYSRKTGKVLCGTVVTVSGSSRVGDHLINIPKFVYQDTSFIQILQPGTAKWIVNSLGKERYNQLNAVDKHFIESLSTEDNPILMIVNYKDF